VDGMTTECGAADKGQNRSVRILDAGGQVLFDSFVEWQTVPSPHNPKDYNACESGKRQLLCCCLAGLFYCTNEVAA